MFSLTYQSTTNTQRPQQFLCSQQQNGAAHRRRGRRRSVRRKTWSQLSIVSTISVLAQPHRFGGMARVAVFRQVVRSFEGMSQVINC